MRFRFFYLLILMISFSCKEEATHKQADQSEVNKSKVRTQASNSPPKQSEPKTQVVSAPDKLIKEPKVVKPPPTEPKKVVPPPAKKKALQLKSPEKKEPIVTTDAKPTMTFERMSHSFGELESGETYEHKFKFTNTGSADLTVEEVKVSCGCTQPSYPFIPVPPGESGYIGFKYNSVGKEGHQKPKVTVYTNAKPAIFNLYLEGEITKKVEEEE